jgi:hypothetical protein
MTSRYQRTSPTSTPARAALVGLLVPYYVAARRNFWAEIKGHLDASPERAATPSSRSTPACWRRGHPGLHQNRRSVVQSYRLDRGHGPVHLTSTYRAIPEPACAMTAVDAPGLSYSSASGRWVPASACSARVAALDATVVDIALPTIGRDFHTGVAARVGNNGRTHVACSAGFRRGALSGALCAVGGLLAAVTSAAHTRTAASSACCGLDASTDS